jgi:hypothetical protein
MRKVQSFISTLLVAAIATLLIWTWAADRTREVRTLTGTVLLRPADAAKQFVDPAQPQSVSLTLKASPATITKLQTLLEQGLALPIGSGPLTGEPGQRMLDLAPIIDQCPEVLATDASVVSVRPDRVEVRVGAMVPVRMPVVAAASLVMLRGDHVGNDGNWFGMLKHVDVILDSYPFGGYTTTMEAWSVGSVPIVTMPHTVRPDYYCISWHV